MKFSKKPGAKKKEFKCKDKKKEDDKPADDGKDPEEEAINGTMVNKADLEAKHNATTEKTHKNEWENNREQMMLAQLKEAKQLQKKTTEVKLQQYDWSAQVKVLGFKVMYQTSMINLGNRLGVPEHHQRLPLPTESVHENGASWHFPLVRRDADGAHLIQHNDC